VTVAFSHLDPGTPERVWLDDARFQGVSDIALEVAELIVVAAHPDDETLGAAGLIHRVARDGGRVTVIVATDGEKSHPDSPTLSPAELAVRRSKEVETAVASLADGVGVHFLGIPDGSLRENADRLTDALTAIVDDLGTAHSHGSGVLVAAPWSGDGHRDHRITAEAVAALCVRRGFRHVGYPIWLWHWGSPDDVPWSSARGLRLSPDEVAAKRRAIAVHESQIEPLSPAAGDEAIVHTGMRAHFERDFELFIDESPVAAAATIPSEWFADFYERHQDPWGFETRWYEQRKRAILMAALPTPELGDVLEIGCATGLVTRELAARATSVIAVDPVPAALESARARVGNDRRVAFVHAQVPAEWPHGVFDTVVLSEVGYYLSPRDLAVTIDLIARSLADDGCLVACHWRHPVADYPQTGDAVHAALRAGERWEVTVRHEEQDFLLEVFSRRPARSVAQRQGLV
jgi:LmbE family N-acetylglucosaminyl deacetylase/SAM-dependent methyltransferase